MSRRDDSAVYFRSVNASGKTRAGALATNDKCRSWTPSVQTLHRRSSRDSGHMDHDDFKPSTTPVVMDVARQAAAEAGGHIYHFNELARALASRLVISSSPAYFTRSLLVHIEHYVCLS